MYSESNKKTEENVAVKVVRHWCGVFLVESKGIDDYVLHKVHFVYTLSYRLINMIKLVKAGISKKMKKIIQPDRSGYITVFNQTDGLYLYRLIQGIATTCAVSNIYMFISEYNRDLFGYYGKRNFVSLGVFCSFFLVFQARIGKRMIKTIKYHPNTKTIKLRSYHFFKGEIDREVSSDHFKKKSIVRGGFFRFKADSGDTIYINLDENVHGEAIEVSNLVTNILLGEKSIIDQASTQGKIK